jgi:DNA-binding CsgD family transcriptional regulator
LHALLEFVEPSKRMALSKFNEMAIRIAVIPLTRNVDPGRNEERLSVGDEVLISYGLTTRQREIARLLADTSLSHKEIAANLGISVGTMRKHVENIHKQLNVHSRSELVAIFAVPLQEEAPHVHDDPLGNSQQKVLRDHVDSSKKSK